MFTFNPYSTFGIILSVVCLLIVLSRMVQRNIGEHKYSPKSRMLRLAVGKSQRFTSWLITKMTLSEIRDCERKNPELKRNFERSFGAYGIMAGFRPKD